MGLATICRVKCKTGINRTPEHFFEPGTILLSEILALASAKICRVQGCCRASFGMSCTVYAESRLSGPGSGWVCRASRLGDAREDACSDPWFYNACRVGSRKPNMLSFVGPFRGLGFRVKLLVRFQRKSRSSRRSTGQLWLKMRVSRVACPHVGLVSCPWSRLMLGMLRSLVGAPCFWGAGLRLRLSTRGFQGCLACKAHRHALARGATKRTRVLAGSLSGRDMGTLSV